MAVEAVGKLVEIAPYLAAEALPHMVQALGDRLWNTHLFAMQWLCGFAAKSPNAAL